MEQAGVPLEGKACEQCVALALVEAEHDHIGNGQVHTDEVITFSHTAYSKAIFGKGALQAALFLAGKEPGMYDMQDVIG